MSDLYPGSFWLLERVDADAPTYLKQVSPSDVWETTDPLEALRFRSPVDAEDRLAYMDSRGFPTAIWEPREHEFVAA